ncbi:MAG: hypothetical protein LGR52_07560 [Candidatus Thiosymbion ectosymbiont of Robbea hypermnestra]|nr:hypothetical protein [Candidatus Thiosymbion ectosymbiont of Robbea hypermnestra]
MLFLALLLPTIVLGAGSDRPDVVIIVDTSRSMTNPGMDPERTSLLVAKLYADIVPGNLAVVRLLDLSADRELLPRRETDETRRCKKEGRDRVCNIVESTEDWAELARENRHGVLARGSRGDRSFKRRLDTHLAQTGGNSLFYLSFEAARGVFEHHAAQGQPSANRTVIWLSDGEDEAPNQLTPVVAGLVAEDVRIETVILGRGDPVIPRQLGLEPVRAGSPAELMGAFAQTFRRIMRAPYRIDQVVAESPSFRVRPNVETMWVVVYGDTSLERVDLRGADGRAYPADYAADSQPRAGAYRVARIERPAAGEWRVEIVGGGSGAAYAVVQRSSLKPVLLSPDSAQADVETRLVAAIAAGEAPTPITDSQVLDEARIRGVVDGVELVFNDKGQGADETAGDGRFSAFHRFSRTGPQPLELHLTSPFADRRTNVTIDVSGVFRYGGPDLEVRFGERRVPSTGCLPVSPIDGLVHQGSLPFELTVGGGLPADHEVAVTLGGQRLTPRGSAVDWAAGATLMVCLELDDQAPSSTAAGEPVLSLRSRGGTDEQVLRIRPYWEVHGRTFWERWSWLILGLLALAVLVFIALGYILPIRFQKTLAICFAPERADIDEYPPQAIRTWRGTGIGFYRNARAFLHPNFRLDGKVQGALAVLRAEGNRTRVDGLGGQPLYRESATSDWDQVPQGGELARPGEVYRIGESGPFFRLSAR